MLKNNYINFLKQYWLANDNLNKIIYISYEKCIMFSSLFRGWYWANYSTTLGATIHEIGHSLDLAHTPRGIMARGHDDMNYFFTQVKGLFCVNNLIIY